MKLLKTIRLDVSDANVFPLAAMSGEWAVTGTFEFAKTYPERMDNRQQLAFRNGWMGVSSFGRATFVQVSSVSEEEYEKVIRQLAVHLHEDYNAPDMIAALDAAREEVSDASAICEHPLGTLLSIERSLTDDGIVERVHVIDSREDEMHARIWTVEQGE